MYTWNSCLWLVQSERFIHPLSIFTAGILPIGFILFYTSKRRPKTNEDISCVRGVQYKCLCVSSLSRIGGRRIERPAAFCEVFVHSFHRIELHHSIICGTYFCKIDIITFIIIITDQYFTRTCYQGFVFSSSDSKVDTNLPLSKHQNIGQQRISPTD